MSAFFHPTSIGAMVHGSRYFDHGGVEYSIYSGRSHGFKGSGQQENYEDGREVLGGTMLFHAPARRFFEVMDLGVQLYRDRKTGNRQRIYGFESRVEKARFEFLGEFAHAGIGPVNGPRSFFREGYYLEPAFRIAKGLHVFYRYDWLKSDSRDAAGALARHTSGLNFRPLPNVSLKLEWNSYSEAEASRRSSNGAAAAVSFFFR